MTTHPATPARSRGRLERDEVTAGIVEELHSCVDSEDDRRLRQELIATNLPMAELLSRRYANRGESDDDLRQVAYVGLVEAVRRFDPEKTNSFYGYCVPTILGELRRHFRDRAWVVRPPRRLQELQAVVLQAQGDLERRLQRSPAVAEIASHVDRDSGEVEEALLLRSCYFPTGLDKPVGDDDDSAELRDLLIDPSNDEAVVEASVVVSPALRRLTARDRKILYMRFVEDRTQRDIAEEIGVTQMQISRVLGKVLQQLREDIGDIHADTPPQGLSTRST